MKPFREKVKSILFVSLGGFTIFSGINIYKGNEEYYRNFVMPLVHLLEPEKAHRLAVIASKYRFIPKSQYTDPAILKIRLFDRDFPNPVGIAAGFDKHAEAVVGLKDIGFGFIEIGSVTPEPQPGNETPRVFRLNEDKAVINRYGFNSEGHDVVSQRLKSVRDSQKFDGIVGVNLGKNKTSESAVTDYVKGIKKLGPLADYLVINVSSPNTPGLRTLQDKQNLINLLRPLIEERDRLPNDHKPPLLLKLAPDLTPEEREDIAKVLKMPGCNVDGLIISNTTVSRPETLQNVNYKEEAGGLSGEPLKDISTRMIADMFRLTSGMPIIGVGGISSGADAYRKIKAGASMVQLYTAIVYEGPPVVSKVKRELAELLARDGYRNVSEAVGRDVY